MIDQLYNLLLLILALSSGAVIGYQRQKSGHSEAGRRTLGLISLGACLYTIMPFISHSQGDPWRMASQVVTGVGFLGGGVLIKEGGSIRGVTTAAAIWVSAAIGICYGCGEIIAGVFVTLISYLILLAKPGH